MAKANPPFPRMIFQHFVVTALILTLALGDLPARAAAQDAAPAQAAAPPDTSPATLDHLLAPVALYPDALLMQILAASVTSQEVLDGGNWLLENKSLEGTKLDAAAKAAGFGAPMTALLHFPDVVDMMCTQLDWTRQVGAAFSADQAGVLASVQRLRAQAVQYGNLKTTPQQQVVTQQDNGKQVIVIQPANPQIVYVPQYNPQVVYVAAPPPSTGSVVAASIISFGVGMAVGAMFSNNNYYPYPRWGYGGVYYGGRPWVPVHYPYRPVYGPHWRPATGYRPPSNYPYHRPNYNNNYFNSYRGGNNTVNINTGNNYNGNRPGNGNNNGNNKPGNGYNKPGNGNNGGGYNKPGNGNNGGGYNKPGNGNNNGGGYNKPGNGNGGNNNRPGAGNNGGGYNKPTTRPTNNNARPAPDRGYTKPATQPAQQRPGAATARPAPQQGRPATQPARPATPQSRPAPQQSRPAPSARPAPAARPSPAFSGGSGKPANAASQRGAASASRRSK